MVFLEGFLVGLGMIIFIGPVFFTLLKSTLQFGFGAGISVALGIVVSDVVCIGLCLFGAKSFFEHAENQFWIASVGSVILIGLGLKYLLKPNVHTNPDLQLRSYHYTGFFAKGFLVNFVNPFVFLVWIGLIGLSHGKYGFSAELGVWLGASLLGIFTTDSLKVLFANKVKKLIQPNILLWAYRIIGILLIGFGFRMIYYAITGDFGS